MKHIAFLTSGGDSPGMNAAIRSIVKSCLHRNIVPFGIFDGYKGMIEGRIQEMGYSNVNNIIHSGGTIIGSSRCPEFFFSDARKLAVSKLEKKNIDGLIVIGGDGTFTGASMLSSEMGIPVIGVPGTIDNDIFGTDHTIGYDTALNTAVDAIDKIRDTASSHHRVFFIEVMGRHAGFIALNAALASGAESVLIPEDGELSLQKLADEISAQYKGERSSIVIVAEGEREGGSIEIVSKMKGLLPGYELRPTVLGHIQRGGRPSAFDRILATRMGDFAVELLCKGENKLMVGVNGENLVGTSLEKAISEQSIPNLDKLKLLNRMLTK
jgi:6-phosphofructokinase 1